MTNFLQFASHNHFDAHFINLKAKDLESLATTILQDMYSTDNKHAFGHYIFLYVEIQKILGLSRPQKISMIFLLVTKISRVTKIVL